MTFLLEKFSYYDIKGEPNSLISSYLKNCKKYASMNGFSSSGKIIQCHVPEGSTLDVTSDLNKQSPQSFQKLYGSLSC